MPSEERVRQALDAFQAPLGAFRSSLVTTADEVRAALRTRQSTWDGRVARVRAELGPLAAGRIDPDRFATLVANHQEANPAAIELLERALETLTELVARGERLCVAEVPTAGSLYDTVVPALAEIGRAFNAARVVHEVRVGRHGGGDERRVAVLPFSRWTKAERRLAPPLVVSVQGSELRAAALAEFLDGRQKIALVVEGECAPAPLARLIAPGTYVVQSADRSGLARLAAWDGPGIAALVPESAAHFLHDPAAGSASWERITITHVPDKVPRRTVGGLSAAQQAEELELLRSLAASPGGAQSPAAQPIAAGAAAKADPADKLAAWLLSRVDLSDLG